MSTEILINVTPEESRVALVENGLLQEVFIERSDHHGIVGSLYKGKVLRVLPGMQAAFVDIGMERSAFLHVSDMQEADRWPTSEELDIASDFPHPAAERCEKIEDLIREGQDILVQVSKDAIGNKGARLTTRISIPSRYLVFIPESDHVGVSARIDGEQERQRLKELVMRHRTEELLGGYIVRTAGEGADEHAIFRDMVLLNRIWQAVQQSYRETPSGARIHDDLPLVLRTLRDLLSAEVERIYIDSVDTYRQVGTFVDAFLSEYTSTIELYTGERPIFDLFGVEDEIQRALDRKVPLKSGGYLVIDQTESMTTVDVNTGGYVGYRNLEETIFKTNLEAAQAIARQLRVRNIGGIIIVDFIDMKDPDHRRKVLRVFEGAVEKDPAKTKIYDMSPLGLVEMTRKRTRESLGQILCGPCSECGGRGYTKSVETVCFEILREILRVAHQLEPQELLVMASSDVVCRLLEDHPARLAELEHSIGCPIRVQSQTPYHNEQFDVVLMS
ncbi:MAG: ribonuclease G [Pseudomonadota bacterium]|nr:ribonuclease G [Pseudomonadota bacterium]